MAHVAAAAAFGSLPAAAPAFPKASADSAAWLVPAAPPVAVPAASEACAFALWFVAWLGLLLPVLLLPAHLGLDVVLGGHGTRVSAAAAAAAAGNSRQQWHFVRGYCWAGPTQLR